MHMWKSSDGNEIEAMFVAADESVLTLVMKKPKPSFTKFSWNRLDEPSGTGRRTQRLKEKPMPKNPRITPPKEGVLLLTAKGSERVQHCFGKRHLRRRTKFQRTYGQYLAQGVWSNKNEGDGDRATEKISASSLSSKSLAQKRRKEKSSASTEKWSCSKSTRGLHGS